MPFFRPAQHQRQAWQRTPRGKSTTAPSLTLKMKRQQRISPFSARVSQILCCPLGLDKPIQTSI